MRSPIVGIRGSSENCQLCRKLPKIPFWGVYIPVQKQARLEEHWTALWWKRSKLTPRLSIQSRAGSGSSGVHCG
jgi:hypothetical protein